MLCTNLCGETQRLFTLVVDERKLNLASKRIRPLIRARRSFPIRCMEAYHNVCEKENRYKHTRPLAFAHKEKPKLIHFTPFTSLNKIRWHWHNKKPIPIPNASLLAHKHYFIHIDKQALMESLRNHASSHTQEINRLENEKHS